jgi:hypothetical protein
VAAQLEARPVSGQQGNFHAAMLELEFARFFK